MTGQQLKNSILQEAIEGRLVPQDPNDEPASVLLDKIRDEKKRLVKEGKLKKKDLEETPISEDEIPFDIPESWEWCRLGEISTYSHTKKKINASKAAPNIWGLDLEDIEKGGRLLCIKSVGERKAIGDKTCFDAGDILYSKLRPYLLKILIAPKNGICTPEIIPFTCYGNICKGYIVNLLKSVYVDRYINSATFGIKMPRVATETMTSLIIPLPPLAEQKRIVAKIEELLPKVEEYGKAQESLDKLNEELPEKLKKSILQEAIEGRLVPQDPNDEPASVLLDKIRAEKKRLVKEGKLKKKDLEETPINENEIPFKIPEGWEWCRLNDICIFLSRGKSPSYSYTPNEYPVFAQKCNLKDGGISLEQARFLKPDTVSKWPEEYHLRTDDVLVNSTGTGTACRTRLFHERHLGRYPFTVPDSHVSVVRTSDSVCSAYIFNLFNSKFYQDYWEDRLAGTTNQKELYIGVLQNTIIPLPPLSEQHRIVAKIEQLMKEIDKLKA